MLDASREARDFAKGRHRTDLDNDRMLTLALLKCLEVIGEAAARISREAQINYGNIPWNDIVGMRNRLVHVYFDIDLDLIWETATQNIPPLIGELEKIIEKET